MNGSQEGFDGPGGYNKLKIGKDVDSLEDLVNYIVEKSEKYYKTKDFTDNINNILINFDDDEGLKIDESARNIQYETIETIIVFSMSELAWAVNSFFKTHIDYYIQSKVLSMIPLLDNISHIIYKYYYGDLITNIDKLTVDDCW